MKSVTINH